MLWSDLLLNLRHYRAWAQLGGLSSAPPAAHNCKATPVEILCHHAYFSEFHFILVMDKRINFY
jgi:hypothetical protein